MLPINSVHRVGRGCLPPIGGEAGTVGIQGGGGCKPLEWAATTLGVVQQGEEKGVVWRCRGVVKGCSVEE